MGKLGKFAAVCAVVLCAFGATANADGGIVYWVSTNGVAGATDLQGNLRIMNKTVDIGCYEVPVMGMTLIVR